ncbi:MAG: serpin family protein [Bacteroidetes bacterium]|nr:serpin family protein [Bacteroidota bacterium]
MKKMLYLLFAGVLLISGCKTVVLEEVTNFKPSDSQQKGSIQIEWARSISLNPETRAILAQNNLFALDFFKAVSKQFDYNLFLSPYSMSAALGMLYNGANGETKKQIAKVLCMDDCTPEEVNQYYYELTKALLSVDPNTSLSLANAIWANKGITLQEPFVSLNRNYYDAEVSTLDFSLPSALKTINDWCNEKTKGTIPTILETMPPAIVILANAIYFNSFWTYDFDKSKTQAKFFRNINRTTSAVPMMYLKHELLYAQMDVCGMVTLPYANAAFAMNLILPHEGVDVDDLIADFDGPSWEKMMLHRSATTVTLSLPRFKIERKMEGLAGVLAAMGMPLAFSHNADFSAMVEGVAVYFDQVIQKSYISVDEAGTEASAVTLMAMTGSPGPMPTPPEVTMVFDRPFFFAITEKSTGALLFMGKVTKL